MKVIVSATGRITIPKRLRERLRIKPGDVLEFVDSDRRLVIRKLPDGDAVDRAYGVLDLGVPTDRVIEELRGRSRP